MKQFYFLILFTLLSIQFSQAIPVKTSVTHNSPVPVIQQTNDNIKVFYKKSTLFINGLNETATIEIFNMLGKKVASFNNIQVKENFSKSISLVKNNIFIVSVRTENFTKTFKIVTK